MGAVSPHMFLQGMESTTTQALKAHYRFSSQLKMVVRELLTRLKRSLAHDFEPRHKVLCKIRNAESFKILHRRTGNGPDQNINFEQRVTSHQKLRLGPGPVSRSTSDPTRVKIQPDHRSNIYCIVTMACHIFAKSGSLSLLDGSHLSCDL